MTKKKKKKKKKKKRSGSADGNGGMHKFPGRFIDRAIIRDEEEEEQWQR